MIPQICTVDIFYNYNCRFSGDTKTIHNNNGFVPYKVDLIKSRVLQRNCCIFKSMCKGSEILLLNQTAREKMNKGPRLKLKGFFDQIQTIRKYFLCHQVTRKSVTSFFLEAIISGKRQILKKVITATKLNVVCYAFVLNKRQTAI